MVSLEDMAKKANESFYANKREILVNFAKNLESLLKESNMKQKDLAEKLCVSEAYISKIMRGEENLTAEIFSKIAHSLDCEVKILVNKKEINLKE